MDIYYVAGIPYSNTLAHHGIKGQKWGIRRYQNEDGSLTEAGRIRYLGSPRNYKSDLNRLERKYAEAVGREDKANASINYYNRKAERIYKKETGKNDLFDGTSDQILRRTNSLSEKSRGKMFKIAPKINYGYESRDKAISEQKAIQSDIRRLMVSALSQNYNVTLTPKVLSTQSRSEQFASMWFGLPYRIADSYAREGNLFVPGFKYKVSRNEGLGESQGKLRVLSPTAYQRRLAENSTILRNRSRSKSYR